MIDIHSHILPGVDDGARSLKESVEIVKELVAAGVTRIVATPHFVDETIYTSPKSVNEKILDEVRAAVHEAGVEVELYLGNEIYMTERLVELIENGTVATIAGSRYVLVELPMSGDYPNYEDIILETLNAGYKVVLAHPERYTEFTIEKVEELARMGVLMQCEMGSLSGRYGKTARKMAREIARKRLVWKIASDIHHPRGVEVIREDIRQWETLKCDIMGVDEGRHGAANRNL